MNYQLTTGDIGKILGFPLQQSNGAPNDFTGATASLMVRNQTGVSQSPRSMTWKASSVEWEYTTVSGDFVAGRYWAMVAVTFPGNAKIYSSEVVFDVIAVD